MPAHLLAAITAHGYGHAAQTLAVLNALRARQPDLALTIASAIPREFFLSRLNGPFSYERRDLDIGMQMQSALSIRLGDSATAYQKAHSGWSGAVDDESRWLAALRPDLVLANVPYRVLAAASRAGVPAVAMSSLNWADIYAAYFGRDAIHAEMLAAYRSARRFFCLTPGMPMDELDNRMTAGVVVRRGTSRREEIFERLGRCAPARLVLIAPGGLSWRLDLDRWPSSADTHWLVPGATNPSRPHVHSFETLGVPFLDVLASADAIIGKPGYGTFVEAACHAVPMLYVRRDDDWPEEPHLIAWAQQHSRFAELPRRLLEGGDVLGPLNELWARVSAPLPQADGTENIVGALEELMGLSQQNRASH